MVFSEVKIYGVLSQPSDIKINDQYYYNYAYNEYSKVKKINILVNIYLFKLNSFNKKGT